MTVRTSKGEFTAPGGVPFYWLFGDEFESERTRVDRIQVLRPRERFNNFAPVFDAARGSAFETPLGACLATIFLPSNGNFRPSLRRMPPSWPQPHAK